MMERSCYWDVLVLDGFFNRNLKKKEKNFIAKKKRIFFLITPIRFDIFYRVRDNL